MASDNSTEFVLSMLRFGLAKCPVDSQEDVRELPACINPDISKAIFSRLLATADNLVIPFLGLEGSEGALHVLQSDLLHAPSMREYHIRGNARKGGPRDIDNTWWTSSDVNESHFGGFPQPVDARCCWDDAAAVLREPFAELRMISYISFSGPRPRGSKPFRVTQNAIPTDWGAVVYLDGITERACAWVRMPRLYRNGRSFAAMVLQWPLTPLQVRGGAPKKGYH